MPSYFNTKKSDKERYLALASRPLRSDKFSKYRGVQKNKNPEVPYRVMLTHKGRRYNLGAYADEDRAARIYNNAALKIIGPYAVLNIIDSDNEECA